MKIKKRLTRNMMDFIRVDELREKLPGIFKPTHKERIEEVVV